MTLAGCGGTAFPGDAGVSTDAHTVSVDAADGRGVPDVQGVDVPTGGPWWGSRPSPHSSTVAVTADGQRAFVVQPDGDTVSVVDLDTRTLESEIPLGPPPRAGSDGRYAPAVAPRAVAMAPGLHAAYVACERSGEVVALDTDTLRVIARARVCSRPVAVLVRGDERAVYVTCAADNRVLALDPTTLQVTVGVTVGDRPWALGLANDGATLYVTHATVGTVDALDAVTLAPMAPPYGSLALPDVPPRGHRLLAHGAARGFLDVAIQPVTGSVWVPHGLLATDTAQPLLDFESTVFPAVTVADPRGGPSRVLSSDSRLEGVDGAFQHVVSGPRALAFFNNGARVLMVARNSESVLVLDAATGNEQQLVDNLPGTLPDGVAFSPTDMGDTRAYVNARASGGLVVLAVAPDGTVRVDGPAIATRVRDPMPAVLREGQWMFHTANDRYEAFPITVNNWVACESCHLEEGTSAVTLQFAVGPRDIPSVHAGLDGFLMHTATRTSVLDFWRTINTEQGGQFRPDDQVLGPYLDALAAYVTLGMQAPPAPTVDPAVQARGETVFRRADTGCAGCHTGSRYTDSGAGNPSLDLGGAVLLHDVGTCAAGDVPHTDIAGHPRSACAWDTPALVGLADSAPYLHNGSAATLRDVLTVFNPGDRHGHTSQLNNGELDALVDFLRAR